ncbi:MAG: (2Fe-2S)-binding protein [Kordiimonadaceae bacterium]|nr:(2Fe-2S)-binding protein [Kordiimonadaceae bacterium]MBO6568831.1 (2Fe-2S)-binding protein [Kordiimonadaceae bacterium]MBO6965194.1 (2Fe-2S)-binding protein [Kordiimonadaceae bacterium]
MYVCLCNGYTDKEIKSAVRENGVKTAEEAYLSLGNGFCCGACTDCAKEIVEAELPNQRVLAAE